ncbi:uncharacterized protein MICPUCDRAFT_54336 [Micromonas pusilla CCMP1545]|uniref:Predicted protein n=1 Tax=Micromonas pusilla (strain CCMP1545) TaxID=564608 RepID=C1N926_MICPC|nr:uncharacterized protein MICPUCDRAFT_54336 [Micromonas pusilla CCMP1545]EEH51447.1 predicted protein [Micromonas pusilla CCMP1545]|eukprot:XP_003064542.1 predicted protein [Micromonas pusilla CCMP1545]
MNSTPDAYELHPAQVPGGVMLTKRTEGEKNEHGGGEDDDDDEFVGSRDGPSRSSVDFDDLVSGLDFGDGDGEGDGAVGGDFQVTTRRLGEPDMPRAGGGASSRASTYRETADEIQRTREARIARDSMPGTWRPGRGAAAAANADVAPYGMNMEARGSGSGSGRGDASAWRREPVRERAPRPRLSRNSGAANNDKPASLAATRRSNARAAPRGIVQPLPPRPARRRLAPPLPPQNNNKGTSATVTRVDVDASTSPVRRRRVRVSAPGSANDAALASRPSASLRAASEGGRAAAARQPRRDPGDALPGGLRGVGAASVAALASLGVTTVGELAGMSDADVETAKTRAPKLKLGHLRNVARVAVGAGEE